jgi:hypothetical protein
MTKLRVLVATVGAAVAIGLFPAPAQATHICITKPENGIWHAIHRVECEHAGVNVVLTEVICWISPTCF